MQKKIMPPSPKKEGIQILPILGGIGVIEFSIAIFNLLICAFMLILFFSSIISVIIFLLIVTLLSIITLFLIVTHSKTELKGWKILLLMFTYQTSQKKFRGNKALELFSEIEIINDETLKIGEQYLKGILLKGKNLTRLDDDERKKIILSLKKVFQSTDLEINLYKYDHAYDFNEISKYWNKQKKMNQDGVFFTNKEWKAKANDQLDKMLKIFENATNDEIMHSVYALTIKNKDIDTLEKEFRSILSNIESSNNLFNKVMNKNELKVVMEKVMHLKNLDDNSEINVGRDFLKIGDKYYSILSMIKYPNVLKSLWLSRVFNEKNITINMNISYLDEQKLINQLDKSIQNNILKKENKKTESINKEANIINQGYQQLLESLQLSGENAKEFSVLIMCEANSKKELLEKESDLIKKFKKENYKLVSLKYRQLDAWKHMIPYNDSPIKNELLREVTTSIIAESWPLINEEHFDENGLFFTDPRDFGEKIVFDPRKLDETRTNSNIFFLATSGAGKTMTMSLMIDHNLKRGEKTFIIDPENEYEFIANYYGGKVIDMAGGKIKINPLQVLKNDDFDSDSLKHHISFVSSFIKTLFPLMNNLQSSKLREYLSEFYISKKITNEKIKKNKSIKWPTFSEFAKFVSQKIIKENKSISGELIELEATLKEFSGDGAYSHIWDGQTNLDLDAPIVIFNINKLIDSDKVISAQMYLLSKLVWVEVENNFAKNKKLPDLEKQWTTLIIDEAHLLMNGKNIETLEWITQATKRIRKRNGSIYIVTQNLSDFLGDNETRNLSSKIINNCTYSFVGALKPHDLSEYIDLYKSYGGLNKYEQRFIRNASKFQFVLSLGNEKKVYLRNTRPTDINKEAVNWRE